MSRCFLTGYGGYTANLLSAYRPISRYSCGPVLVLIRKNVENCSYLVLPLLFSDPKDLQQNYRKYLEIQQTRRIKRQLLKLKFNSCQKMDCKLLYFSSRLLVYSYSCDLYMCKNVKFYKIPFDLCHVF